ncbi:DUF1561 family protein, partial [Bartonella sp. F02]|uniref:DUF1561 family protein n=1 Tax=Bartonella sp. F02 TaxID=2967262 RepID=UPI0022A9DD25
NKIDSIQSKAKEKLFLPPDFQLTDAWRRRLYAIATTTDGRVVTAGVCGPCLLHTYQMLAELQEYYPGNPLTSGGYFFNTQYGTSPIDSFRQRYPFLYDIARGLPRLFDAPLTPRDYPDSIIFRMAAATTRALLPRFTWRESGLVTQHDDIIRTIVSLLTAPPGTAWVGIMSYVYPTGESVRHAVPILRGQSGIIVVPTNTDIDFAGFTELMREETHPDIILSYIIQRRNVTLTAFNTLQLISQDQEPLSVVMSQNNCTGEGNDRRGSRMFPRSSTVNQCSKGRCSIM